MASFKVPQNFIFIDFYWLNSIAKIMYKIFDDKLGCINIFIYLF